MEMWTLIVNFDFCARSGVGTTTRVKSRELGNVDFCARGGVGTTTRVKSRDLGDLAGFS